MGQKNGECGTASQNESAFNVGIVVAAPVLSIEKLLNDSVLILVVITEIELAGNKSILYKFECARMRFDFHGPDLGAAHI